MKKADKIKEKQIELILKQLDELEEETKLKLKKHEETHKTEYFKPFKHQERLINFIIEGKKTVLMVGANQIGKTVLGSNISGAFSLGCKEQWENKRDLFPSDAAKLSEGKGIIGRILCNDWEKAARDTIVPKLKEWLPEGTYETKKNNIGVEHEFYFPKTKSKFTILTYKEDTKSHEGWTGDWILADEPPPRDKYVANSRGLVARGGIFIMTMTAISEPWILDDIVLVPDSTTGIVADIPITANTSLTPESIRIYESKLTEDEKSARIKGGWMQLAGRIWKNFDVNKHIIDPFKIPPDWPCDFQVDFHLDKPHAISFRAVDPFNRSFIFDEVWQNMGTEEIADAIIREKLKYTLRMKGGEIDPLSKGDSKYVHNRFGHVDDSFTIIKRKLQKYGLQLEPGSKDEKSYIRAVEEMLKGPNNIPTLFITRNCPETIKQVQRWSYDKEGVPSSDGHFPECIGRFTQNGLKYTRLELWNRPLKYAEMGV